MQQAESLAARLKQTDDPSELNHPEIKKALAEMELIQKSQMIEPEQQELLAKVKQDPSNLQARYDLATSFFASKNYQQALDQCFEIIKIQKHWNEDAARKLCLKIFEALGPESEITTRGRKKLSNLWFL